ncbi:MAG: L-galactose dehydrogenase, partial [Yoonia sp.]
TNAPLPEWLKEPQEVKDAARAAAKLCEDNGVDIAQVALQFSIANPDMTTAISGSANPNNIRKWADWAAKPIAGSLLKEVLAIFEPVKNLGHKEGLEENN